MMAEGTTSDERAGGAACAAAGTCIVNVGQALAGS
jgi:hypothetical protein